MSIIEIPGHKAFGTDLSGKNSCLPSSRIIRVGHSSRYQQAGDIRKLTEKILNVLAFVVEGQCFNE